ncbi:atpase aaa-type core [Lucifera butyrica]|uniref:ATP-dependent zinc metalloprotease FtsH n=1 Tax=Lucifera butyrica TaxID=1351585 RepID=A0A498R332_9FIRM|nr:ATP-dependent zinc metalloprotease FtsH [Lucifera butyrica]VBB05801.1 atpase aaa-type core [Lucifera butyrica]
MSYRKRRTKLRVSHKSRVTFGNVAGAEEAKQDLMEILEFIKHPKKFREMGARIPNGVLLYGPPGTGKTLLARATAGEAGVPFFSISASEFVEMYVGVGASRVRDLFRQARRKTPSIIFIDEIDAVGRQRGTGLGDGHDEREQTLNQLLVEMDGFSASRGVIIIAATNRPDILDPALLRAGRFDRRIFVDRPDAKGRQEILNVHTAGKPVSAEVDLAVIARRISGFTGADIGNLVNEAALLAIRFGKKQIEMDDFEEAIELVIAGPERKSRVLSERDRKIVAYHEAGHALISLLSGQADPLHKVSIVQRGRAGGYTLTLPREDRYFTTKSELVGQIKKLLGGRVAEVLVLQEISTGAQNDLKQAAEIAHKMVCDYGMSSLGPVSYEQSEEVFLGRDITRQHNRSEGFFSGIDQEIRDIIKSAYGEAEKIIQDNINSLHRIASALLERETLAGDDVRQLVKWESFTRA